MKSWMTAFALAVLLPLNMAAADGSELEPAKPEPVLREAARVEVRATPAPITGLASTYEMEPKAMALLLQSQDALFRQDFDECQRILDQVHAMEPDHPLPRIFTQALLLYEIEINNKLGQDTDLLMARLEKVSDDSVASADAYALKRPGAVAKLYLGGSRGARGLGQLHLHNYIRAYKDGKKAYALLRECVAEEPGLYNAYVGLGQFEYFSGRLSGALQYLLDLEGDTAKGIELLETCSQKGSYAAPSALMFLGRVYSYEEPNPDKAFHCLKILQKRYPRNPEFVKWCLDHAAKRGWDHPESTELVEAIGRIWDQGWRPPKKYTIDFEADRLALADAQLKGGRRELAMANLGHLAASDNPAIAKRAKDMLEGRP